MMGELPSGRLASRCAGVLVLLALARSAEARAEPPARSWAAPDACPSAERGWAGLDALLGESARTRGADVRIEPIEGERWRATVRLGEAERVIEGRDCVALTSAIAVVIAVSLDPVTVIEQHEVPIETPQIPDAPIVAVDAPIADVPPVEPIDVEPPPQRREPLRHILRGGVMVGWSAIPAVSGGPQLGYAFGRARWRVEALATYAIPRTLAYADGAGGRFQSWMLGVHGCGVLGQGVSVPLCAGVEGGGVRGRGRRVVDEKVPVAPVLQAVASASLVIAVRPRLGIRVGADLLVALLRPKFHVGERAALLEAPQVGGRVGASLEWRIR
jgi:hypothetical protein